MNVSQKEKALRFVELHRRSQPFVIANAWDGGSARLLAGLGFEAIATSSGASAGVLGRVDGQISRDEALTQVRIITAATDLPVSADLEKGFADAPSAVAETIQLAADSGVVGASIEDASGDAAKPIYEFAFAVERIAAAVEAARGLPFPFTLTARCENFLNGRNDLDDTIRRLQAYEKAGADVLFAPNLPSLDAVHAVCSSLTKPVNFMVGRRGKSFSVKELGDAGVRRISLATSLFRAAMQGLREAALEVKTRGTFSYIDTTMSTAEWSSFMQKPS